MESSLISFTNRSCGVLKSLSILPLASGLWAVMSLIPILRVIPSNWVNNSMIVHGILAIHLVGAEFIKIHAHGLPMLFNILFPEFGHFFHSFIFCENRFGDA